MNKSLKFILLTFILFFAGFLVFLQVIKPRIGNIVAAWVDEQVDARISYRDIDISVFRSFPSVSISLDDLVVSEKNAAEPDTLAALKRFSVVFNPVSLVLGRLDVEAFVADQPRLNIERDSTGVLNWDVFVRKDAPDTSAGAPGAFELNLSRLVLRSADVVYHDNVSGIRIELNGWDHELSGRFRVQETVLNTGNSIESFSFTAGDMTWLSNVALEFDADIEADLENKNFILRKNRLKLNELCVVLDGAVNSTEDGMETDISFRGEESVGLRDIVSLLPALYAENFSRVETGGNAGFEGWVKGVWRKGETAPFGVMIDIDDGVFGYRGEKVRMKKIDVRADISSPGGSMDNTVISAQDMTFDLEGRPFRGSFVMKNPVSDPRFEVTASGNLMLEHLTSIYPLEHIDLSGELLADLSFSGRMSDMKEGRTANTRTSGTIGLKNVSFAHDMLRPPFSVPSARITLQPSSLRFESAGVRAGKSDFSFSGSISGYMGYFFADNAMQGRVQLVSRALYLDEFENLEEEKKPLLLPERIALDIEADVGRAVVRDFDFREVRGLISLRDRKLSLSDVTASTLGGTVKLKGYYSTRDGKPDTEFSVEATEMNIATSYESVPLIKTLAPVAGYSRGDVSAAVDMNMKLDDALKPILETVSGKGRITTSGLKVEGFPPVSKIGSLLDMDQLDTLDIGEASLDFVVDDGQVTTPPFDFAVNDIFVTASGTTGFDRTLDWVLEMTIPSSYIGPRGKQLVTGLLDKLPLKVPDISLPDTLLIDARIRGSVSDPEIGLDIARTATRMSERAARGIGERITGALKDRLLPDSADTTTQEPGQQSLLKGIDGQLKTILGGGGQDTTATEQKADTSKTDSSSAKEKGLPDLLKSLF
jgi:hypothetical protein